MNTNQTEALIGMVAVLAILVLLVLPSAIGVVRDRRIDRQLKQAEARRSTEGRPSRQRDVRGGSPARGAARAA